ncbi:MAG TPA: ribonuclease P protein component [Marinilabiliaceae bacterium]|nr:ribonuclease P protein component [Marinilabiliaceae bacterium]
MSTAFTFNKRERLHRKKLIDKLFIKGRSFMTFPLRDQYLLVERVDDVAVQILVSVPKKRFKRAVDRNLLKRRIKEAYRLNKQTLLIEIAEDKTLLIACIYSANEILPYEVIAKAMTKGIEKLKRVT